MDKDLLKGLSEEQLAKARQCKSNKELLALAKKEGIELTEEQLKSVNGGCAAKTPRELDCPMCQSPDTYYDDYDMSDRFITYHCRACGHTWNSRF